MESTIGSKKLIWLGSPSSKYQASHAWYAFRAHYPLVSWHKVVWFSKNILGHSCISWMAVRRSLRTKDKLHSWGIIASSICSLCDQLPETLEHLLFECPLSNQVWAAIANLCCIPRGPILFIFSKPS